jgi:hypothetical protein
MLFFGFALPNGGHRVSAADSSKRRRVRAPRCVADLVAARPVHLTTIDGIGARPGEGIGRNSRHVTPCSSR